MTSDANTQIQQLKQQLRQDLRARRRNLSPAQQSRAAEQFASHAVQHTLVTQAQHIAVYWPNDGELDTLPLASALLNQQKHVYLPVLVQNALIFKRYTPTSKLDTNTFGIPEPSDGDAIEPEALDICFMPLVGFDERGNRLGMGGGFYDRTFAETVREKNKRPFLVGVAHACQQIQTVPTASWDVPLSVIMTEDRTIEVQ